MFWFEGNYHWCWIILFLAGFLFGIAYLRRRNKEVWDEEIARIQSFLKNLTSVALTDTRKLLSPDLKLDQIGQEMKKRDEQMLLLEKEIASKQSALSLDSREYDQLSLTHDERKRALADLARQLHEVEAGYDDADRIYGMLSGELEQKGDRINELYKKLTSADTEHGNWMNKMRELSEILGNLRKELKQLEDQCSQLTGMIDNNRGIFSGLQNDNEKERKKQEQLGKEMAVLDNSLASLQQKISADKDLMIDLEKTRNALELELHTLEATDLCPEIIELNKNLSGAGMELNTRKAILEKLGTELQNLRMDLKNLQTQSVQAGTSVNNNTAAADKVKENIEKEKGRHTQLLQDQAVLKDQISALANKHEEEKSKVDMLQKTKAGLELDLSALETAKETVSKEPEFMDMEKKIAAVESSQANAESELRSLSQKLNDQQLLLRGAEELASQAETGLSSIRNTHKKLVEDLEREKKKYGDVSNEHAVLKNTLETLEKRVSAEREKSANHEKTGSALDIELITLEKNLAARESELVQQNARMIEIGKQSSDLDKKLAEQTSVHNTNRNRVNDLTKKIADREKGIKNIEAKIVTGKLRLNNIENERREIESGITGKKQKRSDLEKKLVSGQKDHDAKIYQLDEFRQESAQLSKTADYTSQKLAAIKKSVKSLQEDLAAVSGQEEKKSGEIRDLKKEIDNLSRSLNALAESETVRTGKIQDMDRETVDLDKRLQVSLQQELDLDRELQKLQKERDALMQTVDGLEKKVDQKNNLAKTVQRKIEVLEKEIKDKQANRARYETELESLREKTRKQKAAGTNKREMLAALMNELDKLDDETREMDNRIKASDQDSSDKKKEYVIVEKDISSKESTLRRLKDRAEALEAEIAKRQKEIDEIENSRSKRANYLNTLFKRVDMVKDTISS